MRASVLENGGKQMRLYTAIIRLTIKLTAEDAEDAEDENNFEL